MGLVRNQIIKKIPRERKKETAKEGVPLVVRKPWNTFPGGPFVSQF